METLEISSSLGTYRRTAASRPGVERSPAGSGADSISNRIARGGETSYFRQFGEKCKG
jgi:hypothetical protein